MALGDQYNNNKKNYSPTVYSQYKFSNAESKVDSTALSISFWNNFLKISISPKDENKSTPDMVKWDHENSVSIYLNHIKARILAKDIEQFMQDPQAFNNVGVDSGSGLISLSNGKEFGVNCPFIVIRILNSENGNVESSYAYQIKQDYHYSVRNFEDGNLNNVVKVYYNDLELEQFHDVLVEYYKAMTGAFAYANIEGGKYNNSKMNTKIDLVMENLGIEKTNSRNNKSSTSIFKNTENRSFSHSTIDDIEKEIG